MNSPWSRISSSFSTSNPCLVVAASRRGPSAPACSRSVELERAERGIEHDGEVAAGVTEETVRRLGVSIIEGRLPGRRHVPPPAAATSRSARDCVPDQRLLVLRDFLQARFRALDVRIFLAPAQRSARLGSSRGAGRSAHPRRATCCRKSRRTRKPLVRNAVNGRSVTSRRQGAGHDDARRQASSMMETAQTTDGFLRHAGRDFLIVLYTAFRSLKLYPIENTQVQKALDDLARRPSTCWMWRRSSRSGSRRFIFVNSTRSARPRQLRVVLPHPERAAAMRHRRRAPRRGR